MGYKAFYITTRKKHWQLKVQKITYLLSTDIWDKKMVPIKGEKITRFSHNDEVKSILTKFQDQNFLSSVHRTIRLQKIPITISKKQQLSKPVENMPKKVWERVN